MKLLKIQIAAIARHIHSSLLEKKKADFPVKTRAKIAAHMKKVDELREQRKKLETELDALATFFSKEYKISYYGSTPIDEIIKNHILYTSPNLGDIESEICLHAAFEKGDDSETFTKKIIEKLEKK